MATLAQRVSLCLRKAGYRAYPDIRDPAIPPGRCYAFKRRGAKWVSLAYRGQSGGKGGDHTYTDPRWREVMLFAVILKRAGFEVALSNYGMDLFVAATIDDLRPLLLGRAGFIDQTTRTTYLGDEFITPLNERRGQIVAFPRPRSS